MSLLTSACRLSAVASTSRGVCTSFRPRKLLLTTAEDKNGWSPCNYGVRGRVSVRHFSRLDFAEFMSSCTLTKVIEGVLVGRFQVLNDVILVRIWTALRKTFGLGGRTNSFYRCMNDKQNEWQNEITSQWTVKKILWTHFTHEKSVKCFNFWNLLSCFSSF